MNMEQATEKCHHLTPELLQQIEELVHSVHYGSVNLIIHDGTLIQIEKSEKIRIQQK